MIVGEFGKILVTVLHSRAGSIRRSLCNLRRYFVCKYCLLLVRLVWMLGLIILPIWVVTSYCERPHEILYILHWC